MKRFSDGTIDKSATAVLRRMKKFPSKNTGSLDSAWE